MHTDPHALAGGELREFVHGNTGPSNPFRSQTTLGQEDVFVPKVSPTVFPAYVWIHGKDVEDHEECGDAAIGGIRLIAKMLRKRNIQGGRVLCKTVREPERALSAVERHEGSG